MKSIIQNEPAVFTAFVVALMATGVSFGLPITDEQQAAVVGLVTSSLAIAALVTRPQVTPNVKTEAKKEKVGPVAGKGSELPTGTPVVVLPKDEVIPEHAAE